MSLYFEGPSENNLKVRFQPESMVWFVYGCALLDKIWCGAWSTMLSRYEWPFKTPAAVF